MNAPGLQVAYPGFEFNKPEISAAESFWASFREGQVRSVTGSLYRAGVYMHLRGTGKTPLTKEQYRQSYYGIFDYEDGMTVEEGEERLKDWFRDRDRESHMDSSSPVTNLVGTLAGSIVSADLPFNYLNWGMKPVQFASWASNTGKTGAALAARQAARFSMSRFGEDVVNATLNAGIQNSALEPVIFAADQFAGREHGLDESLTNIAAGFMFGVPIAAGKNLFRAMVPDARMTMAAAAMRAAETGAPTDPAIIAAQATVAGEARTTAAEARAASDAALEFDPISPDSTPMEAAAILRKVGLSRDEVTKVARENQGTKARGEEIRQEAQLEGRTVVDDQSATLNLEKRRQSLWERMRSRAVGVTVKQGTATGRADIIASLKERMARFKAAARAPKTDDENLLHYTFQSMFGVEVRFVDAAVANENALYGVHNAADPKVVYIRSGDLSHGDVSMVRIAGHEMAHAIRTVDPAMWVKMADVMVQPEVAPLFGPAWNEVLKVKKDNGSWPHLTLHEKYDEVLATVLGHALERPGFWDGLAKRDLPTAKKLFGFLSKANQLFPSNGSKGVEVALGKMLNGVRESDAFKNKKLRAEPWDYRVNYTDAEKTAVRAGLFEKGTVFAKYSDDAFRSRFRAREREVFRAMDKSFDDLERIVDSLFHDEERSPAELTDRSGTGDLVRTDVRVVHGDPKEYAMGMFKSMVAKNPRAKAAVDYFFKAKWHDKAAREKALRMAFDMGPLVTWRQVGTGPNGEGRKYIFTFNLDDEFPLWREFRPEQIGGKDTKPLDTMPRVAEHYQPIYDSLIQALEKFKFKQEGAPTDELKQVTGLDLEQRALLAQFFDEYDYGTFVTRQDFESFHQDLQDFLEARMAQALRDQDKAQMRVVTETYRDVVTGELRSKKTVEPGAARDDFQGIEDTQEAGQLGLLDDPFKELRNDYPKINKAARDEFAQLVGSDPNPRLWPDGASIFFDPDKNYQAFDYVLPGDVADGEDIFKALARVRSEMIAEHEQRFMSFDPDKPVVPGSNEHFIANFFMMHNALNRKGVPVEAWENIRSAIERQVDAHIYETYPGLRRALDLDPQGRQNLEAVFGKDYEERLNTVRFDDDPSVNEVADFDSAMEMSVDDALRHATEVLRAERAEKESTFRRAVSALESVHKEFKAWATDPVKNRESQLEELKKRNNLSDFLNEEHLVQEKLAKDRAAAAAGKAVEEAPPPVRTRAEQQLLDRLSILRKHLRLLQDDVELAATGRPPGVGKDAPPSPLGRDYLHWHYRNRTPDPAKAAMKDLKAEYLRLMTAEVKLHEGVKYLESLGRSGENNATLLSSFDGQGRSGSTWKGVNMEAKLRRAFTEAVQPLHQYLKHHGLQESWRNGELAELVMFHIETGKAPNGSASHPHVVELARVLELTNEALAGRLNASGAAYRLRKGFAMPQVHDAGVIAQKRAEWSGFLMENLDWDEVQKAVGLRDLSTESKQAYIDGVYETLSVRNKDAEGLDPSLDGGNLANLSAERRTLIFKPGKAFEYDVDFGSGSPGDHIFNSIKRRAEAAALYEVLGPLPREAMARALSSLGLQTSGPLSNLSKVQMAFDQLLGLHDIPENVSMHRIGQAIRQYLNFGGLWQAGISSFTDVAGAVSTMRWMGYRPADLHADFVARMKDLALKPEGRAALEAMGAAMDIQLQAYRTVDSRHGNWFTRGGQIANDLVMKYSGMTKMNELTQFAFLDFSSRHLGEQAGKTWNNLDDAFKNWLARYDIGQEDWALIRKDAGRVDGLEGRRLAPDMVKDRVLREKLGGAVRDSMTYAQLQPSITNEGMLRWGTQAGTPMGETLRFLGHWKSYPLAILTKQRGRFAHLYEGTGFKHGVIPAGEGGREMLAWSAGAVSAAILVLAIKDVLRGHEPLNPFEADHWTWSNIHRVITQAGTGPMMVLDQLGSPSQALGPAFGGAYNFMAKQGTYGKTEAFFKTVPILPSSIGPVDQARKSFLGVALGDSYMEGLIRARAFRLGKTGQDPLLDFTTD